MASLNRRQLLRGLAAAPLLARAAPAAAASPAVAGAPVPPTSYLTTYVAYTILLPDPFRDALADADKRREGEQLFARYTGQQPLPALLAGRP